jgi:transposase
VDTLPASQHSSEPNNEPGIASLVLRLQALNPKIVLLEATGGYEIPIAYALYEAGMPVVIMNPKALRHFAKAIGKLAKTDKLDAQVLALYAQTIQPPLRPLRDQEQLELANLMTRRRQLQLMIGMEENRRRTCTPKVRGNIDQHLAYLRQLLKDLDREIHDSIRRTPLWHENSEILQSVTGVGPKVSASLIADMTELGTLPGAKASSLAGLAP